MVTLKKGIIVLLALAALFSGAFAATFVVGKASIASASSQSPALNIDIRAIGTFVIPAGNQTFCVNSPPNGCVLSQVALATPPKTIDCAINVEISDPLFGGTHSCYDPLTAQEYGPINEFHVLWNSGFLSLFCEANCRTNEPRATITYS